MDGLCIGARFAMGHVTVATVAYSMLLRSQQANPIPASQHLKGGYGICRGAYGKETVGLCLSLVLLAPADPTRECVGICISYEQT
jgi:hypothetical protein